MNLLIQRFYNGTPVAVAKELLGKIIINTQDNKRLSGRIIEVEAYEADKDEAAHSFKGKTERNKSLFLDAGHIYVHSIHGQYCMDIVTDEIDIPTSVLIRALCQIEGIEVMKKNRNKEKLKELCSGPGKLMQALGLDKNADGINLLTQN
ncbi:DNA-3-methyladenine glycosylase [Candidatus Dojkabacteria bacterium]|uniref:Putative 3-methyladenine DNA glycosylase n=1 Tax=Candidatus Dojkabacteria bacterium TaxID=2099670 RepID=A0A955IF08_9BACT|nr:DNA-3-methyladenine glycosylase [Candidatus Dojkabacteria bacterium]